MKKGALIGIGVGVGVIIVALVVCGFAFNWFGGSKVPVDNDEIIDVENNNMEYNNEEEEEYVGKPLENIINRAGTIKKVRNDEVIINGPDDEDIYIYVTKKTKIYGPDGNEKEISALEKGMYITVDIDGDARDAEDPEDEFDAMIIYISGK